MDGRPPLTTPTEPQKGRRLRDRLADRPGTQNPRLLSRHELVNLMLFVDDDLRETALALGGIETFLAAALALLDKPDVRADELAHLASDAQVGDRLEQLADALDNLRRRFGALAGAIR
jgi:hypothetical protein